MSIFRSPFQILEDHSKIEITPDAFIHMAISFYSAHPEKYGESVKSLEWSVANSLTDFMKNRKLSIRVANGKMLFVEDE